MFLPLHAWPRSLHERRRKRVTHSAFGEKSHTAAYTAKQGAFRMGVVSLLSERSARSPTSPGRVSERQVLPLLGLGRVLPKNAESLRNSDALMRVAVPRRRGPAGLRDPIAVSLAALMGFTVLSVHDNSTQRTYLLFHTLVCSMRLATRCRSFALSTASICR